MVEQSDRWGTRVRHRSIVISYLLLSLATVMFILFGVILEGVVSNWSLSTQRWLVAGTHILPALLGVGFGVHGLLRDRRRLLAGVAVVANALFTLFFLRVLAIAG